MPPSAVDLASPCGDRATWPGGHRPGAHTGAGRPSRGRGSGAGLIFVARSAGRGLGPDRRGDGFQIPQACQQHYTRLTARQERAVNPSTFELLALHAAAAWHGRGRAVAQRFGLDPAATEEFLQDAARGWTNTPPSPAPAAQFLTDRGRAERAPTEADHAATGGKATSGPPITSSCRSTPDSSRRAPTGNSPPPPTAGFSPASTPTRRGTQHASRLGRLAQGLPHWPASSAAFSPDSRDTTRFAEALARAGRPAQVGRPHRRRHATGSGLNPRGLGRQPQHRPLRGQQSSTRAATDDRHDLEAAAAGVGRRRCERAPPPARA